MTSADMTAATSSSPATSGARPSKNRGLPPDVREKRGLAPDVERGGRDRQPATAPAPALEAVSVEAGYVNRRRRTTVVRDVDAALHPGEFVCLLGPNGAGKSTLLRTLVGSQDALAGAVRLGGTPVASITARQRAQRLSVVLTDRIDVGYLTAHELVAIGRTPRVGWMSRMGANDRDVVQNCLVAAGALDLADRQVTQLSDGERQRVMIARALAQEPDVLVLDEPTAFLDLTRRVELLALLRDLTDTHGLAVLMSTHELELALRHADALWLVHPDGRFCCGSPEDLGYGGEIAAAYTTEGVVFDEDRDTFVPDHPATSGDVVIALHGDERARRWVRRAMARAGIGVVDHRPGNHATAGTVTLGSSASACGTCQPENGAGPGVPSRVVARVHVSDGHEITWEAMSDGGSGRGTSCTALVAHLRALPSTAASTPNDDGIALSPTKGTP